jgi:hypothetical protein
MFKAASPTSRAQSGYPATTAPAFRSGRHAQDGRDSDWTEILRLNAQGKRQGQFLSISEDTGGKRNIIIIPSTGLDDFKRVWTKCTN